MSKPDEPSDDRLSSMVKLAPDLHRKLFKLCLALDPEKYPEATIILNDKNATLEHLGNLNARMKKEMRKERKEKRSQKQLKQAEDLILAISAAIGQGNDTGGRGNGMHHNADERARKSTPPPREYHSGHGDAGLKEEPVGQKKRKKSGNPRFDLLFGAVDAEAEGDHLKAARLYGALIDFVLANGGEQDYVLADHLQRARTNYLAACTDNAPSANQIEAAEFLIKHEIDYSRLAPVRHDAIELYQRVATRVEEPTEALRCAFKAWELDGFAITHEEVSPAIDVPGFSYPAVYAPTCSFRKFISENLIPTIEKLDGEKRQTALDQLYNYCSSDEFLELMLRAAGQGLLPKRGGEYEGKLIGANNGTQVAAAYNGLAFILQKAGFNTKKLWTQAAGIGEAANSEAASVGYRNLAGYETDPAKREELRIKSIWISQRDHAGLTSDQQANFEDALASKDAQIRMTENTIRHAVLEREIHDALFLFFYTVRDLPEESTDLAVATRRLLLALHEAHVSVSHNAFKLDDAGFRTIEKCRRALARHYSAYQGPMEEKHEAVYEVAQATISEEFGELAENPRWRGMRPLIGRISDEEYANKTSGAHYTHTNILKLFDGDPEIQSTAIHESIHFLTSICGGFPKTFTTNGQRYFIVDATMLNEGLTEYFTQEIARKNGFPVSEGSYKEEVTLIRALATWYTSEETLKRALVTGDFTDVCRDVDSHLGEGAFLEIANTAYTRDAFKVILERRGVAPRQ